MFPVLAEQKFCISLWDSHKVKIKRTKKTASSLNDFKVYPFQVFPAPKGVSDFQYFCQIVPAEGKTLMYRPLVSLQTLPQVQEPLGIPLWANQPDQPVWDEQENYEILRDPHSHPDHHHHHHHHRHLHYQEHVDDQDGEQRHAGLVPAASSLLRSLDYFANMPRQLKTLRIGKRILITKSFLIYSRILPTPWYSYTVYCFFKGRVS